MNNKLVDERESVSSNRRVHFEDVRQNEHELLERTATFPYYDGE